MWTELRWVEGPWPGKLALAARQRGGEWLEDEIASWAQAGADTIVSFLTDEEERDLELVGEETETVAHGMKFLSFPILDRHVPDSERKLASTLEMLDKDLTNGKNVVLHCRQGIGRTGLVAACLLLTKGLDPETALQT